MPERNYPFEFKKLPTCTMSAMDATSTNVFTFSGVTSSDSIRPENVSDNFNKILDIIGEEVALDEYITRTTKETTYYDDESGETREQVKRNVR